MSTMAFTFFFRNAQTLELAIDRALPDLCGRAFIHVWDAGCANGAEPYTLAILLRERMSDFVFRMAAGAWAWLGTGHFPALGDGSSNRIEREPR
jgi:chemotaxis methyl-accepting protein methylase